MNIDDLTAKEVKRLTGGKPVYRDADEGGIAGVHGYRLVSGSLDQVWEIASDLGSTPAWVDHVADAEVHPAKGGDGEVTFHINTPLGVKTSRIRHREAGDHTIEFEKTSGGGEMKALSGTIRARETEKGVLVDARVIAQPNVWAPKTVVRVVVKRVLGEIVDGLHDELTRRYGPT